MVGDGGVGWFVVVVSCCSDHSGVVLVMLSVIVVAKGISNYDCVCPLEAHKTLINNNNVSNNTSPMRHLHFQDQIAFHQ